MKSADPVSEFTLLRFSLAMGIFFTVLGVSWGLAIQSAVILFDGIYSGMSILLTALSLLAARILNQPDDETFQFGRMAFEPMVVALKSVVIVSVCIYGIVTSAISILAGGDESTNSAGGMAYGLIAMTACLFSWLYLKRHGEGMPVLVQVESEQWFLDTLLSAAVMLSFILSYYLAKTEHAALVPYIDPAMVILGSMYFIRLPLLRLYSSIRELSMAAPTDDIQQQLQEHANAIVAEHGFLEAIVRSAKIGRELAVDVAFIAHGSSTATSIAQQDSIREDLFRRLAILELKLWMNVLFTADRRWA